MGTNSEGSGRSLALVTGASSGIGRAYAERLAADGYDLVVVARRGDRLEELKRRLQAAHGVSVQALVADLSTDSGQRRVDTIASDSRVEIVVDNAALAHYMPFIELPSEKVEQLVRLNALAPVRLIHAALPGMVGRGRGTVITIASQLVFSATADNPQLPQRCRVHGHQGLPLYPDPSARSGGARQRRETAGRLPGRREDRVSHPAGHGHVAYATA
jgi:short-subunit dehydrogenase